eukprot:TRINITY_DN10154_c0_g2_i1.p1 TRINITY_DN10154_c0_g2~~TRINITY_DN10154_c0_g2_i1.p1  ORF type:complete len:190 (+),score=60.99 TRINITY_DN10154_c0_g2_i1:60-572(+)
MCIRDRSKIEEGEFKLKQTQEQRSQELKMKHNLSVMKRLDRVENVQRISKVQDFERQKIMERIEADNERADRIKMERQQLLEARKEMKKQMELSKQEMLEKFDKVKRGKLDAGAIGVEAKSQGSQHSMERASVEKSKMSRTVKPESEKKTNRSQSVKKRRRQACGRSECQ